MQGLDAGGRVEGVDGELYVLRRRGRGINVRHSEQIGGVHRPGQCKLQGIDQEEVQRRSQAAADAEEEGCGHKAIAGRGAQGLLRLCQGISCKGEGCSAYFQRTRLVVVVVIVIVIIVVIVVVVVVIVVVFLIVIIVVVVVVDSNSGNAIDSGEGDTRTSHNKEQTVSGKGEKRIQKRMMEAAMLMQSQEYMLLKLGVLKIELLSSESGKCEWQMWYSMLRRQRWQTLVCRFH